MNKTLLATVVLVAVACVSAPPPAPTPTSTEHRVDVGDGVHIFYTLHGDVGPVVIVPVGRIVGDLQPLVDAGYRVAIMDARGRGLSTTVTEGIPHSLETDLSDIDAVRQDVGVERVHLIGISYYGALVGVYAARYPDHVDRVVMLGPMAPTAEIFAERTPADHSQSPAYLEVDRMRREGLHESDPPAFCRAYYTAHAIELYSDPSRFDPSAMSSCDLENEWPDNIQRWANNLFARIGPWDFTEDATAIEAPVLLVQGRQDQITPPRGASVWSEAMTRQASIVWLDDCGHVPLKEHPQETMELILDFLRE